MSRLLHEVHTKCNCMYFNWRSGITTISIITETIQLAITYICILILKCLKTHIGNVRIGSGKYNSKHKEQDIDNKRIDPSIETINELEGKFSFISIQYQLCGNGGNKSYK